MDEKTESWRCLRSENGPDLKLFRARFDHMLNPRNGASERMIVLESNDSVNVVALTHPETMLFVRQYRFGIADYTLELPGGIVDDGESPDEAARRELQEETGFSGGSWQALGKIPCNPVFQDAWIHHYLARDIRRTQSLSLDPGEEVEVVEIPVKEVREKLLQGAFLHPHTVNALLHFFGKFQGNE